MQQLGPCSGDSFPHSPLQVILSQASKYPQHGARFEEQPASSAAERKRATVSSLHAHLCEKYSSSLANNVDTEREGKD